MMFWCHSCQKPIVSIQQATCQFCSSEAIELIDQQNQPQFFQPFVSNQVTNSQIQSPSLGNNQNNIRQSLQMLRSFSGFPSMGVIPSLFSGLLESEQPMMVRYQIYRPIFGVILLDNQNDEKVPVEKQKIEKFERIEIKQECSICQQKEGKGFKLPCKHQFHEHCIKPWFEQTNTCPCCRSTV